MENLKFNLTKILNNINSKIQNSEEIEILLDNNHISFRNGGVSYYCDYKKFQEVLEIHDFNYHNSEKEGLDTELLSRHIINQLTASLGKKIYPDVKTLPSDLNQN